MPDLPSLRIVAATLADESNRHVFIDKSRQMMVTWEISAYMIWRAQFHPMRELLVMSKKDKESDYIVRDRMYHIWAYQPRFLREFCPVSPSFNKLEFGNGTRIEGLPEGEDQFRGHQSDSVFMDECAAMDHFGPRYRKGAAPMANHRCRVYAASTPSGHGDWWECVKDIQRDKAA